MSSADVLAPSILSYIDTGAYPTDETVFSSTLDAAALASLLDSLRKEQESVKDAIRTLSRSEAGHVDGWIERAKVLQQDIERSKLVAREIVEEAETLRGLREKERDERERVGLLEKEVGFYGLLGERLEKVGVLRSGIGESRGRVQEGDLAGACEGLKGLEIALDSLGSERTSGVGAVVEHKVDVVRQDVRELISARWQAWLKFKPQERSLIVENDHESNDIVHAATHAGMLDALVLKMTKDVEKSILRPRMEVARNRTIYRVVQTKTGLSCPHASQDTATSSLFEDLTTIVEFLATHLPKHVAVSASQHLIPTLTTRLEEDWLEPAIPLDVTDMPAFQSLLSETSALASLIERHGWHGAHALETWVNNAPRSWLSKRRGAVLGDVRNLVFTGLRETKTVERVETQMVRKDEVFAENVQGGNEDDWDTAWDESDEQKEQLEAEAKGDDDDGSAWEIDEDVDQKATTSTEGADDEGEAWGWDDGDDNASKLSSSPRTLKKQPSQAKVNGSNHKPVSAKPTEREVTFRETYMVTAIPEGLIELVQQVIEDAQKLAGPEYASSPIAPAATALYTLPTLALAIYRATAPTAYSKLGTGNMLIYNDASRLSEQLRAWQAEQPASSRLRLDNDVKTLDHFAKRAYTSAMEAHRTIIRDLLDGAQGFSNCTTPPFKAACEAAVEDAVHHLRSVYQLWKPILSEAALLQSIGSLLAALTSKIVSDVEELFDISEADSKQIKILCEQVITSVRDLFTMPAHPSAGGEGEARDMTFIYCPTWMKFQYLAEIMESSLADIKYLWNEGELSLEFEAEEVVGLIEALFAESALRRGAIAEIRRGGRR